MPGTAAVKSPAAADRSELDGQLRDRRRTWRVPLINESAELFTLPFGQMNPKLSARIQPSKAKKQFAQSTFTNFLIVRVSRIREVGNPPLRIVLKWLQSPSVGDDDKLVDLLDDTRRHDLRRRLEGSP